MSLRTILSTHMKDAMRAKDKARLGTIRLIQAEIKKSDIESRGLGKGDEVDDVAILALMQKMIKQRMESIKIYEDNDRADAAANEQAEIEIIQSYLPKMRDAQETRDLIATKIAELGAQDMKDMGKVVGAMKSSYPGELDMGMTSKLIKDALS